MLIGKKLKELRKNRKISLTELSKLSGVQIATLSRIENEKMKGTIDSHMQIAKALGVPFTDFYNEPYIREESKKEAKIEVQTAKSLTDVFVHSEKSAYEILTNNVLNKKMMPILLKIDPEGQTNLEENQAGAEKFVFVLEGKIEIHIGEQVFSLAKNNTLYFDASLLHRFVNTGKTPARVLCVVTPVQL